METAKIHFILRVFWPILVTFKISRSNTKIFIMKQFHFVVLSIFLQIFDKEFLILTQLQI